LEGIGHRPGQLYTIAQTNNISITYGPPHDFIAHKSANQVTGIPQLCSTQGDD
jgi:hypothetical protein